MPRLVISFATYTISSRDGVIRPDRPIASAFASRAVSLRATFETHISQQGSRWRLQDFLTWAHYSKVNDFVVVTPEDNGDDILADVMDIALNRSHDNGARARIFLVGFASPRSVALLLFQFEEGQQVGHRLLHHPSGLDDLQDRRRNSTPQQRDHPPSFANT